MPVEIKVFFFSSAISFNKGKFPNIGEATLLKGRLKSLKKICESLSQLEADQRIFLDLQ